MMSLYLWSITLANRILANVYRDFLGLGLGFTYKGYAFCTVAQQDFSQCDISTDATMGVMKIVSSVY